MSAHVHTDSYGNARGTDGALLILSAVVGFAAFGALGADFASRAAVVPPRHRVDLSTADVAELALLPEVGPALAARIAADRATTGLFPSVEALLRVPGVGAAKLQALRGEARVGRGATRISPAVQPRHDEALGAGDA